MKWVSGIAWNGQNYEVETVDTNGITEMMPVEGLADLKYEANATKRFRVSTDFSTWRSVSPVEYLDALGFPAGTKSCQDVFEFEVGGEVYQIPAVLMMKGFLTPLRELSSYLFRPQGVENIFMSDGTGDSIKFFRNVTNKNRTQNHETGKANYLSWLYCFPTARLMLDSILIGARKGEASIKLPSATLNFTLHAFRHNRKWYVINLSIFALSTNETPFVFSRQSSKTFIFNHSQNQTPKKINTIPTLNGQWSLSDEEWLTIEPLITTNIPTKFNRRSMINSILRKFGEGISWDLMDFGDANRPAVVNAYQMMLKNGRWDKVLGVLKQLRGTIQSV